MQALVMTSEQYLTEQQREQRDSYSSPHPRHHMLSRLTEEEDSDSHMSSVESEIPPPGQLKHSDSLLLLTQVRKNTRTFTHVGISPPNCVAN